ncbi:cation:proton antiporter [Propionivibrio soli]|uniref:cation:proton antiporter n=1 Tax=Propionivibrio soli TaxID=2976531 RepID=UPI0021E71193|nr:cation:proton antiporter [Propionivibrio soli]
MSFQFWAVALGALMIAMALGSSLLKRLPLSASMLYLAAGYGLGVAGIWPLLPDPRQFAALVERGSLIALLISLFSVGLKLGLPYWGRRWILPMRLALLSMMITVALIAAAGMVFLKLPLGAAILLGGILAPTDPVLAADVQVEEPTDRDRLRFSLTGEGALNDGAAFPFVMLGLGMVGLHDLGPAGMRWITVDLLWALAGGLLIGILLGHVIGKLVLYLRTSHNEAVGLDEFISLGLIGLAYGAAQIAYASGFLAVFAAGLALQRVTRPPRPPSQVDTGPAILGDRGAQAALATHPELAGPYMTRVVRNFNEQLERIAELLIVLLVGVMLPYARFDFRSLVFVVFIFLLARPISVWLGLIGESVSREQQVMISWFGIRGIGSVYYLMFVLNRNPVDAWVTPVLSLTLSTVAVSIIVHGISVTPLMAHYARRQQKLERGPSLSPGVDESEEKKLS